MPDQSATDADALEFLDKLAQFHATLNPTQQAMLDEMTAAALQAPEVEGFIIVQKSNSLLRQSLLGQLGNTSAKYYDYYASVGTFLTSASG